MKQSFILLNYASGEVVIYNDIEMTEDEFLDYITKNTHHKIINCYWLISKDPIEPEYAEIE